MGNSTKHKSPHRKRTICRVCGSKDLHLFLSLGPTPLANSFLKSKEEFILENSYPLDVYFCERCSLVQLLDVIDPEVLFRDYIYVTGTSDTIKEHNREYAKTVTALLKLGPNDLILEVASNDGSLLKHFKENKVRILGIEPAANIAEMANKEGIETINEFFDSSIAKRVRKDYGAAKAVIGNNVLAHVDNTPDFLDGFAKLLTEDGLVIVEVPYLGELLDRLEYDTIYHEHLCYFSVNSLLRLCDEIDLSIVRIDRVPVHGGSLRMYAGKKDNYPTHSDAVLAMAETEKENGLTRLSKYNQFAKDVEINRNEILKLLNRLKESGKTVVGYGAPAKGNTFLNFAGIDTQLLSYTVDKNPMKVELFTPGMHIPVRPATVLRDEQPDYVLILAWNFAEEIMKQQHEYHKNGGKFIIPIPKPKIVS